MQVKLQNVTPNAETNLVEIARVSSSRKDKSEAPEGLINYMIKNNHWSPFEHSYMTVEIVTSKAIAIQFLRHRSFTFQEFSQRYAKVENFEPIELRAQAEKNSQSSTTDIGKECAGCSDDTLDQIVAEHLDNTKELYEILLDHGVAKECARFILPMTTQTTLYMTGAIRNWIHFLNLRDDSHAQKEAQLLAKEIKKIFIEQFPIVSSALGWVEHSKG